MNTDPTFTQLGDPYGSLEATTKDCIQLRQAINNEHHPVIIKGLPQSGKRTLIDTIATKYTNTGLKIVVDGYNESDRYSWAHVKAGGHVTGVETLEDLLLSTTPTLEQILTALTHDIEKVRKPHYFHDKAIPLQDAIDVYFVGVERIWGILKPFLLEQRTVPQHLKIRMFFTVEDEEIYEELQHIFNSSHILIILGSQAQTLINDLSLQVAPTYKHIIKGICYPTQFSQPFHFPIEVPRCYFHDGKYYSVHTGINLSWQSRISYSRAIVPVPNPVRFKLNPQRHTRINFDQSTLSGFQELAVADDDFYEIPGSNHRERHIEYDYADDLAHAITNVSESLQLLNEAVTAGELVDFAFDYIGRTYHNHTQIQPKALSWFVENPATYIEMMSLAQTLEGIREYYSVFTSRNLNPNKLGMDLKHDLLSSGYPSSKEGLASLLRLKSIMVKLLPQIVKYLERRLIFA